MTLNDLELALGSQEEGYVEPTFDCPFCVQRGVMDVGHLHVNIEKNAAICHSCEYASRNLSYMLFQATGKRWGQRKKRVAPDKLVQSVQELLSNSESKSRVQQPVELPEEFVPLTFPSKNLPPIGRACAEYLKERGVSEEQAEEYGIGYARSGRFFGMLIFPVYFNDKVVSYTSRRVLGDGVKSLNASTSGKNLLYGYEEAFSAKKILVTEGPLDALTCPPSFGRGIAVLGHVLNEAHARLLSVLPAEEICICFDADSHEETISAANLLDRFTEAPVSYLLLDEGDVNDRRKEMDELLEGREFFEYAKFLKREFFS